MFADYSTFLKYERTEDYIIKNNNSVTFKKVLILPDNNKKKDKEQVNHSDIFSRETNNIPKKRRSAVTFAKGEPITARLFEENHFNFASKTIEKEPGLLSDKKLTNAQTRMKKKLREFSKELISYKKISLEKDYGISFEIESEGITGTEETEEEENEKMEIPEETEEIDELEEPDEHDDPLIITEEDDQEEIEEEKVLESLESKEDSYENDSSFFEIDMESMLESERKFDFSGFTMKERIKYYKRCMEGTFDFGIDELL